MKRDAEIARASRDRRRIPVPIRVFLGACAVLLALDAVIHRHVVHPFEGMFGFYPLYGFVACVLLVLAATQMRRVVGRREDHYDVG
jgi:hypothetical protein